MIQINDKYFIDANSNNYILKEKIVTENEDGEKTENLSPVGYYPTVTGALQGLLKKEFRKYVGKKTTNSITEAIKEFERLEKEIKEYTKNM